MRRFSDALSLISKVFGTGILGGRTGILGGRTGILGGRKGILAEVL